MQTLHTPRASKILVKTVLKGVEEMSTVRKHSWHALNEEQIIHSLRTSVDGLTQEEANKRLDTFGLNEIKETKKLSRVTLFARQLKEPLIMILLAATTISALIGEIVDAIIIIAIIIITAFVGFIQEYKSERSIEALKKMTSPRCRVIRDNAEIITEVRELVPGDIIIISAGDIVPADGYIIEAFNLEVNESPLTGESFPVSKYPTESPKETPIAERKNILYTLTTVTSGRGKAIVFATGIDTELGKIASAVQSIDVQKTPFELKISHIAKLLSLIMLIVASLVSILTFTRGYGIFDTFVWGISLAVAAVPEALPAVITASLAISTSRMAKQNAIVKHLPAVETLGSTTIICSDKTGTLTTGQMTVRMIYVYDKFANVTGAGYTLDGNLDASHINATHLDLMAKGSVLCNDANVWMDNGDVRVSGDPTEIAMLIFAYKLGFTKAKMDLELPRTQELSFSSERKMMSTIHKLECNKFEVFTKGACEVVIGRCDKILIEGKPLVFSDGNKDRIIAAHDEMAKKGLRVLALAYKQVSESVLSNENVECNLLFLGLIGMMDPPRTEVIGSIAQCKSAGINVVMITGDHMLTAVAVAREIGIIDDTTKCKKMALSGKELELMDVRSLSEKADYIKIYSRVSPEHKLKIVKALKNKGHVIAMTGDGINDAPALKAADIGIAMGITGSQVAKESASIILADDNFATIVSAIKEGRRIFDNVKKYLVYLLSVNLSEIIILAFSGIVGWPLVLLAKHILYINLATDGSPAIALGLEPHEPDIMKRKPRNPKESVFFGINRWLIPIPIILTVTSLLLFAYVLQVNGWSPTFAVEKARTMIFAVIVFFELFFALSCRSFTHSLRKLGFFSNKILLYSLLGETLVILFIMNYPPVQRLFEFVPLQLDDWIIVSILATFGFLYSEIIKLIKRTKA